MRINKIFGAATATFFASVYAQLTAPQIVANINVITDQSQEVQATANSIDHLSGPLFLDGQGAFPQVVVDFSNIATTAYDINSALAGTQPLSILSDEQSILDAFNIFVEAQQVAINIVSLKAELLTNLLDVGPPVQEVLRSLQDVVDTLAFNLIDLVPDVAVPFTQQKESLDITFEQAINAYNPVA